MIRSAICTTALLVLGSTAAQATILTFDEVPGTDAIQTSLTYQGFQFSSEHFHTPGSSRIFSTAPYNGSTFLGYESERGHPLHMTRVDGGVFSLLSLDVAEFFTAAPVDRPNAEYLEIAGLRSDGSSVFYSLNIDGLLDNRGPIVDFEHFVLPPMFFDLTQIVFTGLRFDGGDGGIALDNIEVDTNVSVPEPGTLALFGLSLALCGVVRRRRA